jgi:hypothetical protein
MVWHPKPGSGCGHEQTVDLREDLNDQQYWVTTECLTCGARVDCRPEDK